MKNGILPISQLRHLVEIYFEGADYLVNLHERRVFPCRYVFQGVELGDEVTDAEKLAQILEATTQMLIPFWKAERGSDD